MAPTPPRDAGSPLPRRSSFWISAASTRLETGASVTPRRRRANSVGPTTPSELAVAPPAARGRSSTRSGRRNTGRTMGPMMTQASGTPSCLAAEKRSSSTPRRTHTPGCRSSGTDRLSRCMRVSRCPCTRTHISVLKGTGNATPKGMVNTPAPCANRQARPGRAAFRTPPVLLRDICGHIQQA